jgi:ArsR family transcriptional regulator, arsenate/arsenite/antimonite-responsive transcriptional repressor
MGSVVERWRNRPGDAPAIVCGRRCRRQRLLRARAAIAAITLFGFGSAPRLLPVVSALIGRRDSPQSCVERTNGISWNLLRYGNAIRRGRPFKSIKNDVNDKVPYYNIFPAMGTEPRPRIMRLLLSAHRDGLVVGDIATELDIPISELSHHLEELKNDELINVRREGTFLRYSVNSAALQGLLGFL